MLITAKSLTSFAAVLMGLMISSHANAAVGVGAKPLPGAEVILDGSRATLDDKWIYWKGPRFATSLPIKWQVVDDPVDGGHCISSYEEAAAGGKYGVADIVT